MAVSGKEPALLWSGHISRKIKTWENSFGEKKLIIKIILFLLSNALAKGRSDLNLYLNL